MSKKFTRTCLGCRNKKEKQELIRILCNKKNEITVDIEQKKAGRGAYICKDEKCFEKVQKGNKLKIALRTDIENKKYEELRGVIFDRK